MVEEVAGLLNASVSRLRPVADRVATLLSGGVDSSIVSTIARDQLLAHDTYSTAFPFDGFETNAEQNMPCPRLLRSLPGTPCSRRRRPITLLVL